ncbi:MAG: SusC/RagA family TonB-linked outer membrane protein, partial [Prevotellaceae bacterium]|nr:SusC/RagA family TonB-linked outer membrane protein [Prevotellaceae bacterium]
LSYKRNRDTDWNSETTLNFDRTFDKHSVGALASVTLSDYHGSELKASATGFAADMESELYQYLSFASSYSNPTDAFGVDRNLSYVGRLSYSYDNRYFLTASMRRDYAGRLPAGNNYGDFPSFTAGWKLSEEAFMPKTDMINLIKLRGSWGRIGNIASIGQDYAFNPLSKLDFGYMNRGSGSGVIGEPNYRPSMTITPGRVFNPSLTWETSEQTDFGIDLELFNRKLSLSVDWFNKRTFNLITEQNYGWPGAIIGISAPQINEGEIRNTGIEINAGWNDKIGDVSYFINANLATLKNTITDIGAADPNTGKKPEWRWDDNYRGQLRPFKSREGDPLYSFWLVKTDGIFQSPEEAAAYVDKNGNRIQPNATAGDLKFIDKNGDGKINDDDREYLGGYFPKMTYAITAGLSWNNLSFSIMLQGVQGANAFNAFKFVTLNEGMGNFNRWNRILDAWPNTNEIPRLTTNDTNGNFSTNSDWYLEDASYLRIKNITVGYDLTQILRKANYFDKRKSALTLSLGAENLLTFTKYTGIDPEVGGNGFDGGVYPVFRTYTLALKLTF